MGNDDGARLMEGNLLKDARADLVDEFLALVKLGVYDYAELDHWLAIHQSRLPDPSAN